jgi:prepilin-type N-terminal cleavage/methylation domain-containing protein
MNIFPPFAFGSHREKTCGLKVGKKGSRGFSLVELLVVLGIIAILTSLLLLSVSGMKGSQNLTKATYDIQGVLDQARTMAMATSTYTWVGFFEESAANPGVAGTGQVVISVVSSSDGTKLNVAPSPTGSTELTVSSLTQVAKLMKIANLHLTTLTAAAVARPSVPAATYQVASPSFSNFYYFVYPLTAASPTYTFTNIIQFDPQGDATRIADVPTQAMEIGLQPTNGTTVATASANAAAIQIAGIGGHVTIYRP